MLRTTLAARASSTRRARNVEVGNDGGRALRDRARLSADGRRAAGGALARRRHRRGRLRRGEGASSRRSTRRSRPSRRSSARRSRCSIRARRRGRARAGSASCTRRCSRATGARSSSTSTRSSSARPRPSRYEDVITYPAVRQDLAFVVDEDVPAGELVAAAREAAGPGAPRDARLRRVPRRAGRRGKEVGRVRASRSGRPSGRSRTRTRRGSASASSRRSPSGSAPSCAPSEGFGT